MSKGEKKLSVVYTHENNCTYAHCKHCKKCLKTKYWESLYAYPNHATGYVYCKKCYKNIKQATATKSEIYINKQIQYWIDRLTDLFCLDHTPIVILKRRRNELRGRYCGLCQWNVTPIVITVWIENNKVSLNTLVHEFLHACGYGHKWELNGWANFGYGRGKDRDRFSRLVTRDLCGKDDLEL